MPWKKVDKKTNKNDDSSNENFQKIVRIAAGSGKNTKTKIKLFLFSILITISNSKCFIELL